MYILGIVLLAPSKIITYAYLQTDRLALLLASLVSYVLTLLACFAYERTQWTTKLPSTGCSCF